MCIGGGGDCSQLTPAKKFACMSTIYGGIRSMELDPGLRARVLLWLMIP